jgi:hypothetical protein
MHIAKRLARGLASSGFKLCIYMAALTAAVALTFGTPTKIKQALTKGKVYDNVVDGAIEQIQKQNSAPPEGQEGGEPEESHIPLDNAAIEQVAHQAFPPELLQSSFEQIIDGTYHWLDGEVTQPDFKVDLSIVKQNLANAIGDEAVRHLQALPVCTPEQVRGINLAEADAFGLPCLPPGLNLEIKRQEIVAEVAGSQDFLKDPVITANNLKNDEGKTPFETLSNAPKAFQWTKRLPWIFGIAGLLAGAATVFLHDDRRRGLFVIARALLIAGVLLLVSGLITLFFLGHLPLPENVADSGKLGNTLLEVIRSLGGAFNGVLLTFAGVYTVLGAGGLLGLHFTKPKTTPEKASSDDPKSPAPSKDKPEPPKTSKES